MTPHDSPIEKCDNLREHRMHILGSYKNLAGILKLFLIVSILFVVVCSDCNDMKPQNSTTPKSCAKPNIEYINMKMQRLCQYVTICKTCPNKNISFWLYTNELIEPYPLDMTHKCTISRAPFIKKAIIKILVHGYAGNKDASPNKELRAEYIKKCYNVISMDYGKVVPEPCLIQSANNLEVPGQCLAQFIKYIVRKKRGVKKKRVHLLGFGLGAQVVGVAGETLKNCGVHLPRVTALDPSLPPFLGTKPMLNKKAAKYVDVIHTSTILYAYLVPSGHTDYYFNAALCQGDCVVGCQFDMRIHYLYIAFTLINDVLPDVLPGSFTCQNPHTPLAAKCLNIKIKNKCPNENITFTLFNNLNDDTHEYNFYKKATFKKAYYTPFPFKILVHGYSGNKDAPPNSELRTVFINRHYNVISMDYGGYVPAPCHVQSFNNLAQVGKCLAHFIKVLLKRKVKIRKGLICMDEIHLLGFGYGAHVVGRAGSIIKKSCGAIPRITALDPATPPFFNPKPLITKDAAIFVDVIHTNTIVYPNLAPAGHSDFYVNSAICLGDCLTSISVARGMAPVFYAESITRDVQFCGFNLLMNGNRAIMGENSTGNVTGLFGVYTNPSPPYAKGCFEVEARRREAFSDKDT